MKTICSNCGTISYDKQPDDRCMNCGKGIFEPHPDNFTDKFDDRYHFDELQADDEDRGKNN